MSKRDRDVDSRVTSRQAAVGGVGPAPGLRKAARTVLAGAALVVVFGVLLTACGDDGGDEAASVEDFCAAIERLNVRLDGDGWFEGDDGDAGDVVLQVVSDIDVPDEISGEWGTVIEMTETRNASEDEPEEDDDAIAAAERVLSYADVQCSVDLGSS